MLSNTRISTRLLGLGLIPLFSVLCVLMASYGVVNQKDAYFDRLYDDHLIFLPGLMAVQRNLQQQGVFHLRQYRTGWATMTATQDRMTALLQETAQHWSVFQNVRPVDVDFSELDDAYARAMQQYERWLTPVGTDALEIRILNESTVTQQTDAVINALAQDIDAFITQQLLAATDVKASAERLTQQVAAVYVFGGTALVLLIGLLVYVIQRSVIRPLRALRDLLRQMEASSDLRLRLPISGRNEFVEAGQAFNQLIAHLQETIAHLAISAQAQQGESDQLNALSQQVSGGTTRQASQIDQIATAVEQMSMAIQEVAEHATHAAERCQQTGDACTEGEKTAQHTMQSITALSQLMGSTNEEVIRLQADTQQIGQVLTVIRNISEQTNLLALNAAIEAARAGEAGRGFAVVADQVRALSAETNSATDAIKQLTEGLQAQADKVAGAMISGQEHSKHSVELAGLSEQAFTRIAQDMQAVVMTSRQISAATREQHQVAASITESVHRLSDDVTEVSQIALRSASGSQTVRQKAGSMVSAVQVFAA